MLIIDSARRRAVTEILAGLLVLIGCAQEPTSGGTMPKVTPAVTVVTVKPQRLVITTELAGRTSAYLIAEVRPQAGGIIQKRLFDEGSDVKAGQILFRIDAAPFQAVLDNASAALNRAEANLPAIQSKANRLRELLADKAVSRQDYDDAAAALKQTEADIQSWKATVETARINLAYTFVRAPISGRIGRSNVTQGALVMANQPIALATIQQLNPMYVDVPQSTTELLRLRRRIEEGRLNRNGQLRNRAHLLFEDDAKYPLEGALQFRDVTVDQTTGSVNLRIVFPNPKGVLLPGMFVRAVVEEGVNERAILIPQQAVSRNPRGNPVALIVDAKGITQQRLLVLDRAIGDKWFVSSGLAPGDRVIIEGLQKVKPGDSVQIVPLEDDSEKIKGKHKNGAPGSAKSN